jgi:pimeloyl-ACP methyl ester carboxylesterase
MEATTVQANGLRFHVVTAGSGPLVLLLHGFPESWYSWRHQLKALSDAGYRVAAPDMRGYGRSSKPAAVEDYSVLEIVADCAGIVEALGESQAVVVGHDWGAPVAWTAAWTRPEVFRAVAALSVPFGGPGLMGLPGDPFGERRPSEVEREIAGDHGLFYQEHFCRPSSEAEFEADVRGWITGALYSFSAAPPLPRVLGDTTLIDLPEEMTVDLVRQMGLVIRPGSRMPLKQPETLPAWISQEEVDFYVAEFERTGFSGGLNYYRALDRSWEDLSEFAGRPVEVPALFIAGDRDAPLIWGKTAVVQMETHVHDLRGKLILDDCGHWVQQEQPDRVNDALVEFLGGL